MPDSWVTDATLTTDAQNVTQITLTVLVDGFETNKMVEISGHATQPNGAFANFYDIKQVPIPDANGDQVIPVSTQPIPPNPFMEGQEITIALRVSKVWVTVLSPFQIEGQPLPDPGKQAEDNTVWKPPKIVSSIDGALNLQGGKWS
jgi:hypothetical protein